MVGEHWETVACITSARMRSVVPQNRMEAATFETHLVDAADTGVSKTTSMSFRCIEQVAAIRVYRLLDDRVTAPRWPAYSLPSNDRHRLPMFLWRISLLNGCPGLLPRVGVLAAPLCESLAPSLHTSEAKDL